MTNEGAPKRVFFCPLIGSEGPYSWLYPLEFVAFTTGSRKYVSPSSSLHCNCRASEVANTYTAKSRLKSNYNWATYHRRIELSDTHPCQLVRGSFPRLRQKSGMPGLRSSYEDVYLPPLRELPCRQACQKVAARQQGQPPETQLLTCICCIRQLQAEDCGILTYMCQRQKMHAHLCRRQYNGKCHRASWRGGA
ncbi:hypothetical protein OE88DRAFT_1247091 [Heliocybe sulcata]|uniref:Uncharacterized protein n=1 Tax=Heliocybe sulcata TaxID=5364 RepID=A0A5C3N6U6_9AGAM|nr:hypothetical protein OE88DRAFT_1247091 [Heliocybe sulcata]